MGEINRPLQISQQNLPSSSGKVIPGGVKTISILDWIVAVLGIILGLLFTVFGALAFSGKGLSEGAGGLGDLISVLGEVVLFIGIFLLGFGILMIFVARGLWKGKNWARIVQIILSVLGIIYAIWLWIQGSGTGGALNLIVNLPIVSYLSFSKKVREAFS
jgi:hypothetical protein